MGTVIILGILVGILVMIFGFPTNNNNNSEISNTQAKDTANTLLSKENNSPLGNAPKQTSNNSPIKGAYMYKLFTGVFTVVAFCILGILNSLQIKLSGVETFIFYSVFLTTIYKLWKTKPKDAAVLKRNVRILSAVVFVIITIFLFSLYVYEDYPSIEAYITVFLVWPTCVFLWWISSKIIKNFTKIKACLTLKNYLILLATISTIAVITIAFSLILN